MSDRSLPAPNSHGPHNDLPVEYQSQVGAPQHGWAEFEEEESVDFRRYLSAVIRNRWLVLIGLVVGAVAGVAAHQMMSPVYTVESTVWIESGEEGGAGDAAPIRPSQLLTSAGWMDLMRSFTVLDPVVENLNLAVRPAEPGLAHLFEDFSVDSEIRSASYELHHDAGSGRFVLLDSDGEVLEEAAPGEVVGESRGFRWNPPADGIAAGESVRFSITRPREAARALYQDLEVSMQGTFMSVRLSGEDPERTTRIVNGVVERFAIVAEDLKRAKFDELQAILEEQLNYAAENLESAEYQLQNFQVRTISLPSEQGTPVAPGLQQTQNPVFQNFFNLKLEQEEARRDYLAIQRAMQRSEAQGRLATEALEVIPSVRESSDLMSALALANEKRAELRALRLRYTEDHPTVTEFREDVWELERETIPAITSSLLANVEARQNEIEGFVGSASEELQQIPPRAVEEARLQRQYQSAENLFNDLQGRFENARLGAASTVPDVRVLDQAQVPESPSSDPRTQFGAMALLAGLMLGLAGAVLRDRVDPVLRRPDQVSRDLGLPILGTIPHARSRNGRLRPADHTQVVESFRNLRLAVSYAHRGPKPLVLTVSSPGMGDGKSFATSNLALAYAELGHRTLVIDGDVRRGTLHTLFGQDRRPGLTDYLAGESSIKEVIASTGHDTLWVITSGSRFSDGPELLGSPKMTELLDDARSRFDVILIDSPPLGAAVDPYLLGTLSGSMLLIFRNGTTDQEVATTRLQELQRLPVQILGAALNDVPAGSGPYRYYTYISGYGVDGEETRSSDDRRLVAEV